MMRNHARVFFSKALVMMVFGVFTSFSSAAELTVTIENIKSTKGHLIIEVVEKDQYESDDDSSPKVSKKISPVMPEVRVSFDMAPGEYMVQVFHDENDNQDLDFSIFSGPKEPVGFSNNPKFKRRPPSWDAGKIIIDGERMDIKITLKD